MHNKEENLHNIRHTLAHLLAASVRELFPGAKNAIGPAIDNGFYQDFDIPIPVSDVDLPKIQKKMREKLKTWHEFTRQEVSKEEALKEFEWNEYKTELINEFAEQGSTLTFYTSGGFVDLCKGGHVENADSIKADAFKLEKITGAYWRGDEKNKMLTRIYGLAFETKEELEAYEHMIQEAKKRDHKILGPQLDLFTFSDLVGGGLPLWTPKGTILRTVLDDFVWQLRKAKGYSKVEIPHITKKELYQTSGHWDKFKDELFRITTREGHEFAMKPMNCPHHTQIYNRKKWSYRELPQRYANTTMVYRDEQSGELAGLSRVRSITQDDAHVFCRAAQVEEEMGKIWDIIQSFYGAVGFELRIRLSLHDPSTPEKYLGAPDSWFDAESKLRSLVGAKRATATEAIGEAAFYGPKIDFMGRDSLGREHQVATIQLDNNMPERFDLSCVNEEGKDERIVMIHAAIMGSIERYLSVLIEHFAGAFPLWLSPVQLSILPVSEKHLEYAGKVVARLKTLNPDLRVEVDERSESIGKKIREASKEKVPYMAIVGDKEIEVNTVSLRARNGDDVGTLSLEDLAQRLNQEIQDKK